jgi:hypothetical protein
MSALFLMAAGLPIRAGEWSLTVLPDAAISYRGEGKVIPQSYVNRFEGNHAPLYRLEYRQDRSDDGYWSAALWHTGVFGGGLYGRETAPDATTGGLYQTNELNVGFTNLFVTWRRPLAVSSVEALAGFSVAREIFKRKRFVVQGTDLGVLDDVNEISAEGIGLGLAGRHGGRFYFRWQTMANYYVQLFDSKTDSSAGQIFQAEGGVGWRLSPRLSLEAGGLRQFWFILGQGNRRISTEGAVPGGSGPVISWNRQETITQGYYLRMEYHWK